MRNVFDVFRHALDDVLVALEASAGTGKTWSITALVLRLVVERGIPVESILLVTFTNKATDELAERLRDRVRLAARHLDALAGAGVPVHADELARDGFVAGYFAARGATLAEDRARVQAAVAALDQAAVSTIHAFCSRVLAEHAVLCGLPPGLAISEDDSATREAACRTAWRSLVPALSLDLLAAVGLGQKDGLAFDGWGGFTGTLRTWQSAGRPWMPAGPHDEDLGDRWAVLDAAARLQAVEAAWARLPAATGQSDEHRVSALRLLVLRADAEMRAAADRAAALGADALPRRVLEALEDPARAPALKAALRARYRAVLVDEFQDTDPAQGRIFTLAFKDTFLRCIGDPKQSIYRFRGADVHAYLHVVDAAARVETMDVNHRSTPEAVSAVNALFVRSPHAFLHPGIAFQPVKARRTTGRLVDPGASSLVFWWAGAETAPSAERLLCNAVAAEVRRLVDHASWEEHGTRRSFRPGQCAVLTATNRQASAVARALRRAGIASVQRSHQSVLDSDAAEDLEALLGALVQPEDRGLARAALAGVAWGRNAADLLSEDPATLADDLALLRKLARHWRWGGALGAVATLFRERGTRARLLSMDGGERYLADLLHACELVQAVGESPAATLQRLRRLRQEPGDARTRTLRLEDDGDAVSVLTVHVAKGLQWPVVFAPFAWKMALQSHVKGEGEPSARRPLMHLDPSRGWVMEMRTTGVGGDVAKAAEMEERAEAARQVYVALTRAEERTYVAWGPLGHKSHSGAPRSGLSLLVGERLEEPNAEGAYKQAQATRAALWTDQALQEGARIVEQLGTFTRKEFQKATGQAESAAKKMFDALRSREILADTGRKQGRENLYAWTQARCRAASADVFKEHLGSTVLAAGVTVKDVPTVAARVPAQPPPPLAAAPVPGSLATPLGVTSFTALARGAPHVDVAGALADESSVPPASAPASRTGIHAFPAGPGPGQCLHDILEEADLASPRSDENRALVERALRSSGLGRLLASPGPVDGLLDMTARVAASRLPGTGTALGHVPRAHMHHEWPFDLSLAAGDAPLMKRLAQAVSAHADGVLGPHWVERLNGVKADDVRGWLTGTADLVVKIEDRWWIVDWKSNRLGSDASAYTTPALLADAVGHLYPLQWMLYLVALHRQLSSRLRGYDPARHLGGAAYAYLRGLGGPSGDDPAAGWLVHRPSPAAVVAWSDALGVMPQAEAA